MPKGAHRRRHIRDKENPKYADHCVEVTCRQTQIEKVAPAKFDVPEAALGGLASSQCEQFFREIDAEDGTRGAHHRGCWQRRGSAPTANIEHARTGLQVKAFDC
jgi:hypothetical protein